VKLRYGVDVHNMLNVTISSNNGTIST